MERRQLIILGAILLGLCFIIPLSLTVWFSRHKLVRVVLLAGDDNVEGYAQLSNLAQFLSNTEDQEVLEAFAHLKDPNNSTNWSTRDDVFVMFEKERHKPWHVGALNMHDYGAGEGLFGPEVEVGHTLGEAFDEPVVIVKAGFSKKSLSQDWRSPSRASKEHYSLGFAWIHTLHNVKYALTHIGEVLGHKYRKHRTQFIGVIWWQGYSDAVVTTWLENYENNLRLFLRDIRETLNRPHLPIVVAKAGAGGRDMEFFFEEPLRTAQENICQDPEFKLQTKCVETFPFVHSQEAHVDRHFHYYGHGDTMIEIGGVLATALTELYYEQYDSKELQEEIEADYNEYVEETEFHYTFLFLGCAGVVIIAVAAYRRLGTQLRFDCNPSQLFQVVANMFDAGEPNQNSRRRRGRSSNRQRQRRRKYGRNGLDGIQEEEEEDVYEDEYEAGSSELAMVTTSDGRKPCQNYEAEEGFKSPIPTNDSALVELDSSSEHEDD